MIFREKNFKGTLKEHFAREIKEISEAEVIVTINFVTVILKESFSCLFGD